MDDRELLARLRIGDEQAFDAIFRAWYAPLVRLVFGMLRDRAVAEELAQDVMLELWRRREGLSEEGPVQAWLFRSVRNRALNHVRHERVQRTKAAILHEDESREASAPATLVAQEMQAALTAAVSELPPRCREVFEMSRLQGRRNAEIASVLGVTVKAVEAQMGRALRHLRERLEPWLREP